MKSKFISFEGIDGSGKTTQINWLSRWFDKKNIPYTVLREPGGAFLCEKIRELLLDSNIEVSSRSETLLFMAARAQLIEEIIKPDMKDGKFIICDRFIDSTIAYQGYGRKLDLDVIRNMNKFSTENITPDITFLMNIDVQSSIKRRIGSDIDRMEAAGDNFLSIVREGYIKICNDNSDRCHIIDAEMDEESIFNNIKQILLKKIKGI
tara:strand:- start:543 stop:1163 length:621 start_codon:yes stop_codon:yes gene_type:complete